jgi:hypothetical protein
VLKDTSEITVFPNEFESRFGTDALNGLEVITTEQNAKINELAVS